MTTINVVSWNVRGLKGKWGNILNLLDSLDILFLSETLLDSHDYHFPSRNFNLIKEDRRDGLKIHGGGLSLYIRDNIHYDRFFINNSPKHLEYIAIKIKSKLGYLHFVFVYNPPDNDINKTILANWLNTCSEFQNILISGDFNAQHRSWGSDMENKFGKCLYDVLEENPFLIF